MTARSLRPCAGPVWLCCALLALGLFGCGGGMDRGPAGAKKGAGDKAKVRAEPPAEPAKAEQPRSGKPIPRKIIYTSQISLTVTDFDRAQRRLRELIREHGAYVSSSDLQGVPDQPRHGKWTVRVPTDRSDEFREAVAGLGELRFTKLDSSDVTDEYYDTQAELANLQAEESAIRKLFEAKQAATKMAELMEVRRELARVRKEIDTLQGRIKRWDNQVAYTTLTVTMDELRGYNPETAPSFGTQVARGFQGSLEGLLTLGRGLVLFVVVVGPWLVILTLVGLPTALLVRRLARYATARLAAPPPPVPPPSQ
jgi:hypothetical protein